MLSDIYIPGYGLTAVSRRQSMILAARKCLNCNKELSGRKRKYCSLKCNLVNIGRVSVPVVVRCVECDSGIVSVRGKSKYCSSVCRSRFRRKNGHWNRNNHLSRQAKAKYAKKYPIKIKAQKLLQYAVRSGKIVRKSNCEKCNFNVNIQAHHNDYSKPYDVEWLCPKCHKQEHLCLS